MRIRSLTNRGFHVEQVKPASGDLEIAQVEAKAGEWIFSVQLRFTRPGDQKETVNFLIRDEDGNRYEVTLPVRYLGEGSQETER